MIISVERNTVECVVRWPRKPLPPLDRQTLLFLGSRPLCFLGVSVGNHGLGEPVVLALGTKGPKSEPVNAHYLYRVQFAALFGFDPEREAHWVEPLRVDKRRSEPGKVVFRRTYRREYYQNVG